MKFIAISQVWGAATGTWPILQALGQWGPKTPITTALVLGSVLVFYTVLGASAVFVLRNRESAIFYLAAAQLPQLVLLQTPAFLYHILAGFYVLLHAGSAGFGVEFGIKSTTAIQWGEQPAATTLGVNVIAAGTLWYLTVVYPRRTSTAARQLTGA